MNYTDKTVPLCPTFTALVHLIAKDLLPEGWDVIPDAPNTLPDLIAYYREHNRIAINVESRHGATVGDLEAHYAFRAWHDYLHVLDYERHKDEDFTLAGERRVADMHRQELVRRLGYTPEANWMGALVQIEIVAANQFKLRFGDWAPDSRAFALRWLKDRGFDRPASLGGTVFAPAKPSIFAPARHAGFGFDVLGNTEPADWAPTPPILNRGALDAALALESVGG